MSPKLLILCALALGAASCFGPSQRTSRYPRPIPTPTTGPVLFSPGYVSSGTMERDAAFSPDGSVFAFTQMERRTGGLHGRIVLLERGVPEFAPFSGGTNDIEPFFDPSGEWLWFASQRPHPDDSTRNDWNIWRVPFDGGKWGEPEIVRGLDSTFDEFYPTVALDGTVAFTAERPGGEGGEDIWLAVPDGDGWRIDNPGPAVNSVGAEFNALLTPDGGALFFSSVRDGDQGGGDLYASARWPAPERELPEGVEPQPDVFVVESGDGTWSEAVALVPYNSEGLDYCPALTPEGLFLVFTSRRPVDRRTPEETFAQLRARLSGPGNGGDDLWWFLAPTVR